MLQRKIVGDPVLYRDRTISVRHIQPDYLGYVGDVELSGFFITPMAAIRAGQRYIDDQLKDKGKK